MENTGESQQTVEMYFTAFRIGSKVLGTEAKDWKKD